MVRESESFVLPRLNSSTQHNTTKAQTHCCIQNYEPQAQKPYTCPSITGACPVYSKNARVMQNNNNLQKNM